MEEKVSGQKAHISGVKPIVTDLYELPQPWGDV
jgi:hypothetical protein